VSYELGTRALGCGCGWRLGQFRGSTFPPISCRKRVRDAGAEGCGGQFAAVLRECTASAEGGLQGL
jgi:hypothetical protein